MAGTWQQAAGTSLNGGAEEIKGQTTMKNISVMNETPSYQVTRRIQQPDLLQDKHTIHASKVGVSPS